MSNFQLQERDYEILYHARMFNYLKSRDHIMRLFGGRQRARKRAGLLARHGYLFRLPTSIYEQDVFGIGNKGARIVEELYGIPATKAHWPQKHLEKSDGHIKHELLNASAITSIMAATEEHPHLRFISPQEIFDQAPGKTRDRFYTTIDPRRPQDKAFHLEATVYYNGVWSERRIKFDWIFGIENQTTRRKKYWYFEAGRGTLRNRTNDLDNLASYTKKFLVYEATAKRVRGVKRPNINQETFGIKDIHPFYLITNRDTRYSGAERMKNCLRWHQELSAGGKGNREALFINRTFLDADDPLTATVISGRGEETSLEVLTQ